VTPEAALTSLFAGGGELGREMAARDWAASPLGPPEAWPAALRNLVRIVLTSRFSMWAAWGPDLAFFYNDAYMRDTLQAKHPWALGRPAREVWAEIWPDIGPRIRSVLDTGVATWDEDLLLFLERSGYREETYHTFSYSPVDDDGRTAGMLCVVTENTQRVLGERRMATLRDLASAVATTQTRADLLAAVAAQLGGNQADLPFTATYLFEDGGARLGCTSGIEPGSGAVPEWLPDGEPGPWPLERIRAGERVLLDDAGERLPGLPSGAWWEPPVQAIAVPIATTAQDGGAVAGFLVVGLNPHRRLDDDYGGFLELVAHQIGAGLVSAGSYEAERRRAEALAELDRAKTDFFSNVSHEFRTPLTLITGPLAELRASGVLDGDARLREELDVIERNAERLGRLVTTLLDFSRIQAGRIDARYEPVDLAATTAELASVFRSAVHRAGLTFTVDCPPLGTAVHVDREMWEKVVLNLLSNALKFTFEGGITVRLRRVDGAAELTVADTGIGVPAEELPRLFERFHRVPATRGRSGEGTGIGLAMVRELIGLHGGAIDVESTPGAGTTFTVRIPLGTGHLPAERVVPATGEAPGVSPAVQPFVSEALRWVPEADAEPEAAPDAGPAGGHVLVADDNADMRQYLQRLLAPHYTVRAVGDGEAALAAAREDPPDLVVSDVMMPGLDGVQLLAALRADPRTSRIPVVLLSARAGQEAAVQGLAAGADDYLVKPFSAQELLARAGAHLQLGRARREAEERFTAMADLAPALIWLSDAAGERLFLNRGWTQFTGRPADSELGLGWREAMHPEDRGRYERVVTEATAAHRGWEVEFRLRRADGAFHWLLERAVPLGGGAATAGYVGSCTDINARYRETERQTLLARVGAALDRETDVDRQLNQLARLMVSSRLADFCSVRVVEGDGRLRLAGIAGLDAETEQAIAAAAANPEAGIGPAIVASGTSVLADAERPDPAGPRDEETEKLARRLGLGSGVAVPLSVRGRVLAVLGLARRAESPPFNDDDRELAEEIAARAALAVDNALLLAEERAAAHRLALLQRATAELSAATAPVDVAEAAAGHIRQLTGPASRVAVFELDPAQRLLRVLSITGGGPDNAALWASIPLHTPLAVTSSVTQRRAIWIEDLADWPGAAGGVPEPFVESLRAYGLASTVALPLTVAGRVVGVIGIGFAESRRFSSIERAMLLAVAEQTGQALERARLYRSEQGIASTLQLSLLPAELPQLDRLALAAHYLPGAEGTQAGGDWYDVVELDAQRVAIVVGDVVGQGPAAAAVMGQLRSALAASLLQGCRPAEALELLDRFAARLPGALASTAACVVVDREAGTVTWARAGHPPPLLITPDGAGVLDGAGAGPVLGADRAQPYSEATGPLAPGATLLLYTDGLVERRGELLDEGLARVRAAAERHAAEAPGRLTRRLLDEVLADTDQPDDVAVIAARLLPRPLAEQMPADPGELAGMRRTVSAWAGLAGLPSDVVDDLQLALGEAMANAVEHAYADGAPGECEYRVAQDPDGTLRVSVVDFGRWRPPPADKGHRGRGLELISALAENVVVDRTAGDGGPGTGTTVRFTVPVPGDEAAAPVVPETVPAPPEPARLAVHEEPGVVRLEVVGELDLASAGPIGIAVRERLAALASGAAVVLDLRPTSYLASAGVHLALSARAEAAAAGVGFTVLTAPGSAPARLLTLAGLEDMHTPRSGEPGR
jgi:PAS domain S-box-containing protein